MATVGKAAAAGGGGQLGVNLVLPGSDTDDPAVWSGVLGAVRCNDENSGECPCAVPTPDYKEAGETAGRLVMGGACCRGDAKGTGAAIATF